MRCENKGIFFKYGQVMRWIIRSLLFLSAALYILGCGKIEEELSYIRGMESYIYGYPLVMMDVTRKVMTATSAPNKLGSAAPINQLANAPRYANPSSKNVVRISLNSLWTTAWLDLDKEPIILSVPDTQGRYYVFSIMSMWTNVFGSIGKRTTGTQPGHFLIAGPHWQGVVPSDIKQTFKSPTRYAWLLGQTQVNGPSDFAAVNAIQAQYKLTPLSAWGKPYTPPASVPVDPTVNTQEPPVEQVAKMDAGTFFNELALLMKDNPPAPEDWRAIKKLKSLGIEPGKPFDINKIDPTIAKALARAVKQIMIKLVEGITREQKTNAWIQPPNLGRFGTDYTTRAVIALVGLGANLQEDTIYPTTYVDGDGHLLNSANQYVMHYDKGKLPPTNATWSISQYKGNFYYPNTINRYAITPWMPLKFNADGSLDIYLQAESPGKDKEANWLPTPPGEFNITIRNYWPKQEALDGTYENPRIVKIKSIHAE